MSDADTPETTQTTNQELPDWARQKISEANAEAARYRTEKRDAVEAAKAEVEQSFQEKMAAADQALADAMAEAGAARLANERLTAAVNALIPDSKVVDFAELLQGETADELASHAEKLKELFGSTNDTPPPPPKATDPTQGQGGSTIPLNGDPVLRAVMDALR